LTEAVANCLTEHLRPRGVGVVLVGGHSCMSQRGARSVGSTTVTSAVHGVLRDDARARAEFLALTRIG
jgi:GTP cyclohydrolase IA